MHRDSARDVEVSGRLLKDVVDASEDPENIQANLANYTAFVQIEMVVKNYIEISTMAQNRRANH